MVRKYRRIPGYVYLIRNVVTGRVYVGATILDPWVRFSWHKMRVKNRNYGGRLMQADYKAHGWESFKLSWFERVGDIRVVERRLIKYVMGTGRSYNEVSSCGGPLPRDPSFRSDVIRGKRSRLTAVAIREVLELFFVEGRSVSAIARAAGVDKQQVARLLQKKSYTDNPDVQSISIASQPNGLQPITTVEWNGHSRTRSWSAP